MAYRIAAFGRSSIMVLLATALPTLAFVACGDDDEPLPSSTAAPATATSPATVLPSPTVVGSGGSDPPGAATVEHPTPLPTVTAVPVDWETFTQERTEITEAFTFRYPAEWFVDARTAGPPGGQDIGLGIVVTPWDPNNAPLSPPPGSLKVDLYVGPPGYGCGFEVSEPTESLGGFPAKRAVVEYPDKAGELVMVESVSAERNGRVYCLQGYHIGPLETLQTFATVLHSFEFRD